MLTARRAGPARRSALGPDHRGEGLATRFTFERVLAGLDASTTSSTRPVRLIRTRARSPPTAATELTATPVASSPTPVTTRARVQAVPGASRRCPAPGRSPRRPAGVLRRARTPARRAGPTGRSAAAGQRADDLLLRGGCALQRVAAQAGGAGCVGGGSAHGRARTVQVRFASIGCAPLRTRASRRRRAALDGAGRGRRAGAPSTSTGRRRAPGCCCTPDDRVADGEADHHDGRHRADQQGQPVRLPEAAPGPSSVVVVVRSSRPASRRRPVVRGSSVVAVVLGAGAARREVQPAGLARRARVGRSRALRGLPPRGPRRRAEVEAGGGGPAASSRGVRTVAASASFAASRKMGRASSSVSGR